MTLQYKDFSIAELEAMVNPKNPRWMPESQMAALGESLKEFGLVEPLIVNTRNNQVVGGHQRIQAAKNSGLDFLSAVLVDLPYDQEMALNLSLNKIKGDWDYDKLAEVLSSFDEADLIGTGFNIQETEAIVANAINEAENLAFGDNETVDEIRNHSDEEIQEELESTVKVQFGMFSKHIPSSVYEAWVERLTNLSPNGSSPAALGSVIAEMLNIQLAAEEEENTDAEQLAEVA
ncbi:ParB N-terminal domain-containing protein [Nostoc sp. DedQUE07]|uniref:ParB N-terminal domain-containing protein n=1 Tax=Nostoc sp. DedQUE07 TaxID=3075392 RepID=UPI002AD21001|nr:ParB N-terminal domain-containing protein [Nostoc sp. DedQUE07]MDZ8131881.1 ParB N-terminal domain-containing protein [Nostoc sp. DedQUE07]